ncbi:Hypothetical Protein FCC1311_041052 [Hondaea fermentalgiana]|uniref:Uncharacterized protein n=1 Tax=Hondaea fermentalgiana TaxID=2315210 RepID=A0A2R5GA32_9STRA|nr:Hypothetical Protein FCC1311_041052 [Hondaea fermentalgiana]|eukprot:GBG27882.1 Hypothetical Protein FCC1311_041052 [Hondaea fermentalgiana]
MKSVRMLLAVAVAALACMAQGLSAEDQSALGVAGTCNFNCPAHSKQKSKVECCNNIYDCKCDKGYKRRPHKGICIKDDPEEKPTAPPVRCPGGIKKKECCVGDACYNKVVSLMQQSEQRPDYFVQLAVGDDDDLIDDLCPEVIEAGDAEVDDDDDEDEEDDVIAESEIFPFDELFLETDETMDSGVSLRASIMDFLEEDAAGCSNNIICAKGTKPCVKDSCPKNQQTDCCCKCKGGVMKSSGRCNCPAKPTAAPTPEPKQCKKKNCPKPYSKPYLVKSINKCKCKCKKGYQVMDGECKPKKCFYKTICKKEAVA